MMEKLAQADEGGGACHPLSVYLPSHTKLWSTFQLRGQTHSAYFSSTPTLRYSVAPAPTPYPSKASILAMVTSEKIALHCHFYFICNMKQMFSTVHCTEAEFMNVQFEQNLLSLFGFHVHSCTHWLTPPQHHPPPHWAHIRGRYWSAKIDDISL